jgi:hypothetical protein
MTGLPRRIAVVATAVLALTIIGVLVLQAAAGRVPILQQIADSTASETAGSSPTGGPSSPDTTPSASAEALTTFRQIEDQVSGLRGLAQPDIGTPDVITRAQLATELKAIFDEEWTPRQLAEDNLILRALGLLTPEQDIRELTERLYGDQVLGFYDFEKRRMVVVTDEGLTPAARITYAHEFTHAMQDAAFDTGQEHEPGSEDDDAALALLSLEEGDASVAMIQWATENLSPDELAGVVATPQPDMTGIPGWMLDQLQFPYLAGANFVIGLWSSGGWQAVDAAYADPPASTEQVLHPDKYAAGEGPITVRPVNLEQLLGTGWSAVDPSTMGEAMLGIWLDALGAAQSTASAAAQGWGGDSLAVARGPQGAFAMAWRITFDTAADQDELLAALDATPLPGISRTIQVSSREVTIVRASSAAVAQAVSEALGP